MHVKCLMRLNKHEFPSLLPLPLSPPLPLVAVQGINPIKPSLLRLSISTSLPPRRLNLCVTWQPSFHSLSPDQYHFAHNAIWNLHASLPAPGRSQSVILSFHPSPPHLYSPITHGILRLLYMKLNEKVDWIACRESLCLKQDEDFIQCYQLFSFLQALYYSLITMYNI